MSMHDGWSSSMMWVPMPGDTWTGAAASFAGMWMAMMFPMMLPSVAPLLWRHRAAVSASGAPFPAVVTAIVGAGYFFAWGLAGLVLFPAGASTATAMADHPALARAAPIMVGLAVAIAGTIQLTPWKVRYLACCGWRSCLAGSRRGGLIDAWRDGARLGRRCIACCVNLMVIPLVVGRMDAATMAIAAAAISAERLLPHGEHVAYVTGAMLLVAGGILMTRAA